MNFILPAVYLNPFLTKALNFAHLDLVSFESLWKVVSDAAIGLHR